MNILRMFEEGDPALPDLIGGSIALGGMTLFILLLVAHVLGKYAPH